MTKKEIKKEIEMLEMKVDELMNELIYSDEYIESDIEEYQNRIDALYQKLMK